MNLFLKFSCTYYENHMNVFRKVGLIMSRHRNAKVPL